MKCPNCSACDGIAQIPKYQYPVSVAWLVFTDWLAVLLFPALPSKFRCTHCGKVFRRYTASGWILLALLILVFVLPLLVYAALWGIYGIRYALWYLGR